MNTFQYCSDLHLEFPGNSIFIKKRPLKPVGDILLLAGDIMNFYDWDTFGQNDFFSYCSDNFKHTYWIPGNHEYYGFDIAQKSGIINENIKHNVSLVNNQIVVVDDARLIFSTLWSKISLQNQFLIQRRLNDLHVIKCNGRAFVPSQYNHFHEECKSFLLSVLSQDHKGKTIVVTHHVPTFMNYPEKYKGDVLNEAFATELYDVIERSNVDYWIYGHHHSNIKEFTIGKTKMVTNQLGYVSSNEHLSFRTDARIML